jgi:hypothetical protein
LVFWNHRALKDQLDRFVHDNAGGAHASNDHCASANGTADAPVIRATICHLRVWILVEKLAVVWLPPTTTWSRIFYAII